MTANATLPFGPLLTILVLPRGGGVHASGRLLIAASPSTALNQAWTMARTAAKSLDRAVQVSVGRSNGTVETFMMDRDGSRVRLSAPPVLPPLDPADPRWTDGRLITHPLVAPIKAAEADQGIPRARAAAYQLAQQLRRELDPNHPYLVLADELQAHFALRDEDWPFASRLYRATADTRHRLRSPAGDQRFTVHNAVASWLSASETDAQVLADGYQLGHLLVRVAPRHSKAIAAVLDRLSALVGR